MGIDIREVVDAASTKPFGFMRFDPGPGMGGHCLPVDPFYLSWRAREFDLTTEFIELAGKVNQQMPVRLRREGRAQAQRPRQAGPRVADRRPRRRLQARRLRHPRVAGAQDHRPPAARGGDVAYHDPHVPELPGLGLTGVSLDEALAGADVAVIVTAHPGVDHRRVAAAVPVVDLRGVTRKAVSTRRSPIRAAAAVTPLEPAVAPAVPTPNDSSSEVAMKRLLIVADHSLVIHGIRLGPPPDRRLRGGRIRRRPGPGHARRSSACARTSC